MSKAESFRQRQHFASPRRTFAAVLLCCACLLAGCTLVPEPPEEPGEVVDQKQELVERIKDTPTDIEAHADLLRLQIRDGDVEGAEATVSHALKFSGTDYRSHLLAAQYHRWQSDLLSAEKSLFTARDLAPQRLEPRVALSGLYHQTYLEAEELEQRRITLELADPSFRNEFMLDLAYANAQLGRDAQAAELATQLVANTTAAAEARSRAHALLSEIALRATDDKAAIEHLIAARKLRPAEAGLVQYAARLVTAVADPTGLDAVFDDTLATQDVLEARWAALFGKWMLAVRSAEAGKKDPLAQDTDQWYLRMEAIAPGHPDTLTRHYQLQRLDPARDRQAEETRKKLEASEFGVPDSPTTLTAVVMLWRAEDALRIGAPQVGLQQLTQLEAREPGLPGLRVLRTIALFKAREDDACLGSIEAWQAENKEPDALLESIRWWILLRRGNGKQVMVEVEKNLEAPNNATLWIQAVARFHVYRAGAPKNG
ncbi:MAG: hypothetical protein IPK87_01590 [Planctomycetes bacterium]|nr:hypothetical protein [Planctomycetota bacterium]